MDATELLTGTRLMPVVVIDTPSAAEPLARHLLRAGITACEVTLRTSAALEVIETIARQVPEMLVGAGSVTQPAHFQQIASAGAQFAVSPGCTDDLLEAANLPYLPGVATPSECLRAHRAGYSMLKLFPAEVVGGVAFLRSLQGPLPQLSFCPTGGVSLDNAATYLALDNVPCIGGSWFVPQKQIAAAEFDAIETLAREAVEHIAAVVPVDG